MNLFGRFLFLVLFVLPFGFLSAQNKTKWLNDFSEIHLGFETNYFIGSPTINDNFINSYFAGEFLDDAIKNAAVDNLKNNNIFGAYNNFKLSYTFPVNSSFANSLHLALENRNIVDLAFEDKLFSLFFKGNKMYEGQEIFLRNNHIYYLGFSQLKAGFINSFHTDRFDHTIALMGNINIGTTLNYIFLKNASLLTAENASFIDAHMDAEMLWVKNNSDNNIKFINGIGGSVDLFYKFECDRGNAFSVAVNDIGFIHWFKDYATTLSTDTSVFFDGILINDIFNMSSTIDRLNNDSIKDDINAITASNSFNTLLPYSVQAYFSHHFNNNLSTGVGFMNVFNMSVKPYYFIDLKYQAAPFLQLVPNVSYGGYSRFAVGLDLVLNYKNYYCYAGSDYFSSFTNSDMFSGKGFYFKLIKKLNIHEASSFKTRAIDML